MLRLALTAAATVAILLPAVPSAAAASRTWTTCDKAVTKAAADQAAVLAARAIEATRRDALPAAPTSS